MHWTYRKIKCNNNNNNRRYWPATRKDKSLWRTYLFINMWCVPVPPLGAFELIVDVIGTKTEFWFISMPRDRSWAANPPPPLRFPYSTGLRFNHVRALRTWCDCSPIQYPMHASSSSQSDAHVDAGLVLQMLPGQTPNQPARQPDSQPASEPILLCWPDL